MTVESLTQTINNLRSRANIHANSFADPGLYTLRQNWQYLIRHLGFKIQDQEYIIRPSSEELMVHGSDDWYEVTGVSDAGQFHLYIQFPLLEDMLSRKLGTIDVAKVSDFDSGIVLEYALGLELEKLEASFGITLQISGFTPISKQPESIQFTAEIEGPSGFHPCGITLDGNLFKLFEAFVNENASQYEHTLDPKLKVLFGPIVIPSKQAYTSRAGDVFDCGVLPSDLIRGYLKRADGKYWSILIEDESIEIVSDLQEPINFHAEKTDRVYLSCEIGDVYLDVIDRTNLEIGTQLQVNRYLDNQANIIFRNANFASGYLTVINENIGVSISAIGERVEEYA